MIRKGLGTHSSMTVKAFLEKRFRSAGLKPVLDEAMVQAFRHRLLDQMITDVRENLRNA